MPAEPGASSGDYGTVERLRDMHAAAEGEDRSRAALLLGLAISDLVATLPDDDHRLPGLVEEGVLRLGEVTANGEAAVPSTAVERAMAALSGRLKPPVAAAGTPARIDLEPETLDLVGKLDLKSMRSAAETARFLMRTMPEGGPLQVMMRSVLAMVDTDLTDALRSGRCTPEHDKVLADLSRLETDVRAAGGSLGDEMSALLRLKITGMRGMRQVSLLNGPEADQPGPAALDELVKDLEAALAFAASSSLPLDSPPLETVAGTVRIITSRLLLDRVRLDAVSTGARDRSWFDRNLQRLHRAQEHLDQSPPRLAEQAQSLRLAITRNAAAVEQAREASGEAGAGEVGGDPVVPPVPVVSPARSAPPPNGPPPPDPMTPQESATDQPEELRWPGAADLQNFQAAWEGMRVVRGVLPEDHPFQVPLRTMVNMADTVEAVRSGRWTAQQDRALEELRQVGHRVAAGDGGPDEYDLVGVRAAQAIAHASRCETMARSPHPADWPDAAELTEALTELEDVLDTLPEADPLSEGLTGVLRALAGSLLLRLAGQSEKDLDRDEHAREAAARLLVRAREHLAKVPAEVLPGSHHAVADLARFERLLNGQADTGPGARPLGGDRDGSFDAGPGDVGWLAAKVQRALGTRDPAELSTTISELRAVRRGLPAGHPDHATVLIWLAGLLGRHATLTNSAEGLADALAAAIEAVRVATSRQVTMAAAHAMITVFGGVMTRDQRVGPFEPAEAALSEALAAAGPDDPELRLTLTIGIGAARDLRGRAADDKELRRRAREMFLEAEQLLGEPRPTKEWTGPAWLVFAWAAGQTVLAGEIEAGPLAARMADRLEGVLAGHPELTDEMAKHMGDPGPLNFGQGGQGMLRGLRAMKEMLSLVGGTGPLASVLRDSNMFRRLQGLSVRNPAPAPPAGENRRLASRGLDRARLALGADRPPASARRPLRRTDRPDPELLRAASADLHRALTGGLDDDSLRHRVTGTLGRCLAELYWLGEPSTDPARGDQGEPESRDNTLSHAIEHLDQALTGSEHRLPTVERADLLDVLARCYQESARRGVREEARYDAERTARAALRELARCVLVADGTERALETAARANEIVARAVGWCLADGRPGAAVEIAEAGRSLVLASVVLAGRVEQVLRGAGEHAAADAWRRGDTPGRLAGLDALWKTRSGDSLLRTPSAKEIPAMLLATAADGIAYLVPPATDGMPAPDGEPGTASDWPAYALVFRAELNAGIEVVELPGVRTGAGTPLGGYLAAFGAALDVHEPGRRHPEGFRGSPHGRAWARALDELGAWTHAQLIEPLVTHVRGWSLDHTPRLTLVPLGELAAIPYAAAWTQDPEPPGRRRYAIHDLVLTHAVSARLLGEVISRPRQPLTERVVLVPDPTGEFPYARATAKELAARLYANAEIYGRKTAPNGEASTERILAALPGRDQPGASLLHLSTHATTEPTARLRTADGWLALSRILEQARGRAPDEASGLVITNACLTDSTRSHYDESVTLATALLAAGATGVIGTRWPIDDDTTATLTYHLHHRLALGHPPAQALRLAQLDLLDAGLPARPGLHPHLAALPHPRLAHPASWAGYTYHGT